MFVGTVPQTAVLKDFVTLKNGFVVTDERMETNHPLVFAAGDARIKVLRQVVTAASDGAIAAFQADKALTEIDEYAKAVKRAGEKYLLYFYSPPVQKSLDLFPVVEQKAEQMGLPLIKLDTFRYKNVAARYLVKEVPCLIRIENEKMKETVAVG
jgi:thioredoxin reductase (NADPH)